MFYLPDLPRDPRPLIEEPDYLLVYRIYPDSQLIHLPKLSRGAIFSKHRATPRFRYARICG
jgi:hypothetical protein